MTVNKAKWCPVDIDGYFEFDNNTYQIPSNNKNYKVKNKAFDNYDYTNEATMDQVLSVICEGEYYFYDQNMNEIEVIQKDIV